MDDHEDTIVAVATPPGEGGVGIVRISGPGALSIGRRLFCFSKTPDSIQSHRLYTGSIILPNDATPKGGNVVDWGLFVLMRSPHSYTGQDMVELQCHGSPLLLSEVVAAAVECGARPADRGEFTRRAFMNGKIDLTQAEAVADLIAARTTGGLAVSARHLVGELSERIIEIRGDLVSILAELEADIDFSDQEIDPHFSEWIPERLRSLLDAIRGLSATYRMGRAYREGVRVVIIGRPNVGKSSLMNALLGRNRAIVTPEPGTTTDTIEEEAAIGGFPVRLVDTCGLREDVPGIIEREGIERTRLALSAADVVVVVGEAPAGVGDEEIKMVDAGLDRASGGNRPTLLVMNKVDLVAGVKSLPPPDDFTVPVIFAAARIGTGIDEVRDVVASMIVGGAASGPDDILITNARHHAALARASQCLQEAVEGATMSVGPEFLALDIRRALSAIGEVTGESTADDILQEIFSRFCVGK